MLRNALVCTANFSAREQPWFASCTAWPEPSTVSPTKWALAVASAIQVGSTVSIPHLVSTHSHFSFQGKSHHSAAWHAKAASFGVQLASAWRGILGIPWCAIPSTKECFLVSARHGMFRPYCTWGGEFLRLASLWSTDNRWLESWQSLRRVARFVAPSTLAKERLLWRASACLCRECISALYVPYDQGRMGNTG